MTIAIRRISRTPATSNIAVYTPAGIAWGSATVLARTRARIMALGLTCRELDPLWDVDTERDLERFERLFPEMAL